MRAWMGSVLIGLLTVSPARAQKNVVSLELLGRSSLYSVNYERSLAPRFGVGAGIAELNFGNQNAMIVPLYVSATPIGSQHSLYVGAVQRSSLPM